MTSTIARVPRYESLDVLRGIAILGTLATNIWIFTEPEGIIGYLNDSGADVLAGGWSTVERVLQQLAQGKFLGLLTLMFGIGLEIQRQSAVRGGRAWPGRYPLRAGLLLLDGLINFILVVEFDVLMGYAVTGIVVAYLLVSSERAQRRWLVVAGAVHLALLSLATAALALAPEPTPRALVPNPYADGSWWQLVQFRVDNALLFRSETIFAFALCVTMFLLGGLLLRRGVLEAGGSRLRRRLMVIGVIGLAADLAIGLAGGAAGVVFGRYGTAPLVALGLLALVAELTLRRPHPGRLRRRLNEVGRMALSCYIGQNVVASVLCYGWGFGLAARVDSELRVPFTIALYVVVALVVMVASYGWLRFFRRGPVEIAWLWCFDRLDRLWPRGRPAVASVE